MTDELKFLAAIANNTERIADVLEGFLTDSREARNVDVRKVISESMEALRDSNPIFALAFKEMERRVDAGESVDAS